MIFLGILAGICTVGVAFDVTRLVRSYWREDKQETQQRHETLRCHELLEQARELNRLAPSHETRLLVVLGEATRDYMTAFHAGDWATAAAFENQVQTIEALLVLRRAQPAEQQMDSMHREFVEVARWN